MAARDELPPEADALDGIALPREQRALFGHAEAARILHDGYRSGRLHHALILVGPRGIGKATLAFRFARFVLSHPRPEAAPAAGADALAPVDAGVAAQAFAGAHPNLLHLRRPWDEKQNRFKTALSVDEVRRAGKFFAHTAAAPGWRIAVVDTADDMNQEAANALLKMLEEPPPRSLFLLVLSAPGRLLPTIRSRCRVVRLRSLGAADVVAAAEAVTGKAVPDADRAALVDLAEGRVRAAIELLAGKGLALHRAFTELAAAPRLDREKLHALADQAAGQGAATDYALMLDFVRRRLSARLDAVRAGAAADLGALARTAAAFSAVNAAARDTAILNLDRKQTVIDAVERLAASGGAG